MKRISIFASGRGSNAKRIIEHFKDSSFASIVLVVSNKMEAPVLEAARSEGIDTMTLDRADFYGNAEWLNSFKEYDVDLIVLAGFLWLIPSYLVKSFDGKIVNIHPALLPKFGGKGMYGMNVHRAVKNSDEEESGITIHDVNDQYDEGKIIFQTKCKISPDDDPEKIAKKVLRLEHKYYPLIIEKILKSL